MSLGGGTRFALALSPREVPCECAFLGGEKREKKGGPSESPGPHHTPTPTGRTQAGPSGPLRPERPPVPGARAAPQIGTGLQPRFCPGWALPAWGGGSWGRPDLTRTPQQQPLPPGDLCPRLPAQGHPQSQAWPPRWGALGLQTSPLCSTVGALGAAAVKGRSPGMGFAAQEALSPQRPPAEAQEPGGRPLSAGPCTARPEPTSPQAWDPRAEGPSGAVHRGRPVSGEGPPRLLPQMFLRLGLSIPTGLFHLLPSERFETEPSGDTQGLLVNSPETRAGQL